MAPFVIRSSPRNVDSERCNGKSVRLPPPRRYLDPEHVPLWMMPEMLALIKQDARGATFPMCAFGAPWQKYTTFILRQEDNVLFSSISLVTIFPQPTDDDEPAAPLGNVPT